jgi:hypothetical protein
MTIIWAGGAGPEINRKFSDRKGAPLRSCDWVLGPKLGKGWVASMKSAYMRQVYMGTVGDMKNLEQHYADMAEKGWMINKVGLFTHRYRAAEPCKKRFFVDFLPQITAFDYPENEDAQDYRRICEESGWTFVAANKQFHVFCAGGENNAPIPIHTDNSIHARIYLKASKKYELPWILCAALMFCLSSLLGRGVELFLSNILLFMALGCCCFSIGYIWTAGFIIRWYIRTRKSAKNGLPMPTVNRHFAELRNRVFAAGTVAFLLCAVIGAALETIGGMPAVFMLALLMPFSAFGVGLWIRRQIDTKRRTRAGNIGLAAAVAIIMEIVFIGGMSFAIMNIPFALDSGSLGGRPALALSDAGVAAEQGYSSARTRVKGTIAVPVDYEHWESAGGGRVRTQVYRSAGKTLARWLYEHLAEEFAGQFAYRLDDLGYSQEPIIVLSSDEAAYWGAEKGMAFNYENSSAVEVLLLNNKTILRISAESANMDAGTVRQAVQRLWAD